VRSVEGRWAVQSPPGHANGPGARSHNDRLGPTRLARVQTATAPLASRTSPARAARLTTSAADATVETRFANNRRGDPRLASERRESPPRYRMGRNSHTAEV
jgi:hypothetical protein